MSATLLKRNINTGAFLGNLQIFLENLFYRTALVATSEIYLVFSKIGATVSSKYHVRLQKIICCNEKSEAATIVILLKKTCNFIRGRLQYCEVYKNTYFENRLWTAPSENQQREVIFDFF